MKREYRSANFELLSDDIGVVNNQIKVTKLDHDLRLALKFNDSVQDYSNYANVPLASQGLYYSQTAKIIKSWHSNGVTGYIKYDYSILELDKDKPFSFALWFKPQYAGRYQAFISNYKYYKGISFGLGTLQDYVSINLSYANGVNTVLQYNYNFSGVDFQHIVVTYDGSGDYVNGLKMYHNGTDVTASCTLTDNLGTNSFATTTEILVGNYPASYANGFTGYLDDFRAYSKALTQTEIDEIYNNGNGSEEYRHEAGLFKAIANEQINITYFKQWNEANESTNNSDIGYTILENDGKEYYWNGTNLVETDGTYTNTISELNTYIQSRNNDNIRPVIYLNSTGINDPTFESLTLTYSLTPSKTFTITQDDYKVIKGVFYINEKKLIQVKYNYTIVNSAEDIFVSIIKNNDEIDRINFNQMQFDDLDPYSFFFILDLTNYEAGTYFMNITLIKGDDYVDVSKNIRLIIS